MEVGLETSIAVMRSCRNMEETYMFLYLQKSSWSLVGRVKRTRTKKGRIFFIKCNTNTENS